jgi:hypothetical protein
MEMGAVLRFGGGKAGSAIGRQLLGNFGLGELGSSLGNTLGTMAGGGISKILGFGDYYEQNTVGDLLQHMAKGRDPAMMQVPEGTQAPSFRKVPGGTRICHREFFMDVKVPDIPSDFNNRVLELNPGNKLLFPWLAAIARNYQQWRLHGAVILFVPLTSEVAAGGPMGSVALVANYNVLEPAFANMKEMLNAENGVSAKPSQGFMHIIECDPSQNAQQLYYVRSETAQELDIDDDARLYDQALIQVATEGLPGSTGQVLGRLVIAYDVELLKPRLSPAGITYWLLNTTRCPTGFNQTTPFGGGPESSYGAVYTGDAIKWIDSGTIEFLVSGPTVAAFYFTGTTLSGDGTAFTFSDPDEMDPVTLISSTNSGNTVKAVAFALSVSAGQRLQLSTIAAGSVTALQVIITRGDYDQGLPPA